LYKRSNMITEEEYNKAQKIVDEYRNQQLNIPLVRLSLPELRQMYNKTYDDMVRYKKKKLMKWYKAEKDKLCKIQDEIDNRN